jgi:7-carboxy-7-deazaguanine synthase
MSESAVPFRITEIYPSIQGEAAYAGFPCTFIRMTGCPLRCRWCDTVYSFAGGRDMAADEVVSEVERLGHPLVELTGGEPMAQAGTPELAQTLIAKGFKVMIETGGAHPVDALPVGTHIIMDLKCPGSGMVDRNRWENLAALKPTDEIKFVLASREDFDWAVAVIRRERLDERFQVLMSCAFGLLAPKDLAAWLLEPEARLDRVRMQLQMHKHIWSPRARGV